MKSMSRESFFKLLRKHKDLTLKGRFTRHWKPVLKELSYLARVEKVPLFITKDSVRFFVAVNKPNPTDNWFPHLNRTGTSLSFMTGNAGKYLADKSSKSRYLLEGMSWVKYDGYDVFELRRLPNSLFLTKLKPNHYKDETALFSTENHHWYSEQKKLLEDSAWRTVPFTPTESQRRMYDEQPKFASWQNDAESFITKDTLAGFGLNNPYSRETPRDEAGSMKSEKPLTSKNLIESLGTLQPLTHTIPKDPVDDVFNWDSLKSWGNTVTYEAENVLECMLNTWAACSSRTEWLRGEWLDSAVSGQILRQNYSTCDNPELRRAIIARLDKPADKDDS